MNEIQFFRTHGFLHLRGFLGERETAQLRADVMDGLGSNYPLPTEPLAEATGYDGYYVPLMGPRSATSRALTSGPRLLQLATNLLDSSVLPKPAKGIMYRDASPWHSDSGNPELRAVKMVVYFKPLRADTGALRVLPGSHHPGHSDRLDAYREEHPVARPLDEAAEAADWPGVVLETEPGDLVVFDVHLWHASLFGRDRTQWSVSYAALPRSAPEEAAVHHYVSSFLSADHRYDRREFPYYDPKWRGDDRPGFAQAMAELGLLDEQVPGT